MVWLFIIAAIGNCVAAFLNVRAFRHWRRRQAEDRETFARLVAFAAFMSRNESGAPPEVRNLARQALPEDIRIEVTRLPPINLTLH